jgi:HPt (histidine-containing phosphotransfer) domain-containing protein
MVSEDYKNKMQQSIRQKFAEMGITDDETLNELIEVSIASVEEELSKIEEILETGNFDELGFHTHTIKGVLLNVGLDEDADRFKEIKHLIEEGKTKEEILEITKERISIFY